MRLLGSVIDSSGFRVGGWDIGDAKALRRKVPDSERRKQITRIIFPLICMSMHQNKSLILVFQKSIRVLGWHR